MSNDFIASQTERINEIIDLALNSSRNNEEIEISVFTSRDFEATTHGGVLDQCESSESFSFGVQCIESNKSGFSTCQSSSDQDILSAIEQARENTTYSTVDKDRGLATEEDIAFANKKANQEIELNLADTKFESVSISQKLKMISELDKKSFSNPLVESVLQTGYEDSINVYGYANSSGIRYVCNDSIAGIGQYLSTHSKTGKGSVGTAGADLSKRSFQELDPYLKLSDEAIYDSLLETDGETIKSGTMNVVLHQDVVAGVLGTIVQMCSADYAIKKSSLVLDKVGEMIASSNIAIHDDPTQLGSWGYSPYDADGLRTTKNILFNSGVFEGFFHNLYTARRMGVNSNSCASRGSVGTRSSAGAQSLVFGDSTLLNSVNSGQDILYKYEEGEFSSKSKPLENLLNQLNDGLFITSVSGWHSGVNAQSGNFSLGAKGVVIKDGEIKNSFSEVTISTTLPTLLKSICAFGNDYYERTSGAILPSIMIENIAITGN